MNPAFLVAETTITANGTGDVFSLGDERPNELLLTLGITHVVEQEYLEITIWGSVDGNDFGKHPILAMPQKFGTGVSAMVLDLTAHADVRFLQARWHVNRWGRGDLTPKFTFYIFVKSV